MVKVIMGIIGSGVVADPLAVSVDMRRLRVSRFILISVRRRWGGLRVSNRRRSTLGRLRDSFPAAFLT
jgi:hypothetical protein